MGPEERDRCWNAFAAALLDREHAFRTPTVLSVDENACPCGRVLTLRAIDPARHWLRFHLDRRSPKFQHWQDRPVISAVFYDKAARWQVRVRGIAQLHFEDAIAREAWELSHPMSRRTYLSHYAPGAELAEEVASTLPVDLLRRRPSPEESELGYRNFALVYCLISDLDSLHLEGTGHQRFRIDEPALAVSRIAP